MEGKLLVADAWTLVGINNGQQTQMHNERLGKAMRRLGWERTKLRFGNSNPENCYKRGRSKLPTRILVSRTVDGDVSVAYECELAKGCPGDGEPQIAPMLEAELEAGRMTQAQAEIVLETAQTQTSPSAPGWQERLAATLEAAKPLDGARAEGVGLPDIPPEG
jgi:hypothetical protein